MCGCGGAVPTPTGGGYAAPPTPPPGTRYWVRYTNGVELPFDHEWQAASALAVSGGTMRVEHPADQPADQAR